VASVPWLIGLGLIEGAFTISGIPSTMAEVSRLAEPGQFARTQAVYQTVQTAVEIAGALAGGALFTLGPAYAFLSITAVCLGGAATAFVPRPLEAITAHETPSPDPARPASARGACAGRRRPPHLPPRA